jgi:hypothetical protein
MDKYKTPGLYYAIIYSVQKDLLHNDGFSNGCMTNGVCITQEVYQVLHNCSMIADESNTKSNDFVMF